MVQPGDMGLQNVPANMGNNLGAKRVIERFEPHVYQDRSSPNHNP